jgi:hypothetical protein
MMTLADVLELLAFDLVLQGYPLTSVKGLYEAAQEIRSVDKKTGWLCRVPTSASSDRCARYGESSTAA